VAGIVAVLVVVTGIRAREDSNAKLREWDRQSGDSDGRVVLPDARVLNATIDLRAGWRPIPARPYLCPRQRLLEELAAPNRRQGQSGPGDRRDRGAGPRPATLQAVPISPARSEREIVEATLTRRKS